MATLNINFSFPTRVAMLETFIRLHELDILLEVMQRITDIPGYIAHCNSRTTRCCTALITTYLITITHITTLPFGPAIAGNFGDVSIINICVPSGTVNDMKGKGSSKKNWLNCYVLLENLLIDGDLNCIFAGSYSTGQYTFSRSLAALVQGYLRTDTFLENSFRSIYRHYAAHGSSRFDRIYLSLDLTQHLYLDNNTCWWRYWKRRTRVMFQRAGAARRRDNRSMENFYYKFLYDTLHEVNTNGANLPALNHIKAESFMIHSKGLQTWLLDITEAEHLAGKTPTVFELIEMQKRLTAFTVWSVRDGNGFIETSPNWIALAFTTFLRLEYDCVEVDSDCAGTVTSSRTSYGLRRHWELLCPLRNMHVR